MSTVPAIDQTLDPQGNPQEASHHAAPYTSAPGTLLVCLPSMAADATTVMLQRVSEVFSTEPIMVASPDWSEEQPPQDGMPHLVPYPAHRTESEWVLNAADYAAAARLASDRNTGGVLLLGTEASTLGGQVLLQMRETLRTGIDLVLPRYATGPQEGLVNAALLYPMTRALYGTDLHFPLPLDAALSPRMLSRLAASTSRLGPQIDDALIWPVAEASIAGYSVREVGAAERSLPRPQEADLNILFPAVTSALFADVENKATFWQRARALPAPRPYAPRVTPPRAEAVEEVRPLVEAFRLAFTNLREIWSLVLPPQSLLSLKKLSLTPAESFSFAPNLWARTVYDFALAFHMRTLNRGHLLGALTPLYLGWVASFLRESDDDPEAAMRLHEGTALAFEQEKPYLVSRWRWPDRFNP